MKNNTIINIRTIGVLIAVLLIAPTIGQTQATNTTQKNTQQIITQDQVQHILIFGKINEVLISERITTFIGVHGFFIEWGWKGGNAGSIDGKEFRIYQSTFIGILTFHKIMGASLIPSGPY